MEGEFRSGDDHADDENAGVLSEPIEPTDIDSITPPDYPTTEDSEFTEQLLSEDPDAVFGELSQMDPGFVDAVISGDIIGMYLREQARTPLLTAAEEIEIGKLMEEGAFSQIKLEENNGTGHLTDNEIIELQNTLQVGMDARDHLIRANTRLVVSIAKRYMGQGLPFPDLIQEGNIGLHRAADKWDYRRGFRFSTYSTWWIRQAVTRALSQKTRTIRIPLHTTEFLRKINRTRRILEQVYGRAPTPEEIADELDVPAEKVSSVLYNSRRPIPLETPVGDEEESTFGDFIEDTSSPSPVETMFHAQLVEAIEEVLEELTPRQQHILRLRFGLNDGMPHTLDEIAGKYGLSRERIRQLEKEALRRLRHPRLAQKLRDFLE